MSIRFVVLLVFVVGLLSCAGSPVRPASSFQLAERSYLYDKAHWIFSGRLAFSDKDHAMSGSIKWRHSQEQDFVVLSGPFGLGRVEINMKGKGAVIKYKGKTISVKDHVDELVESYAGIPVPISALKYWVVGLVNPDVEYYLTNNGFSQESWDVSYSQMQRVHKHEMPRKIKIERSESRLKLVIDHWEL
jgi:outer membrane lipoprotein LolB